MEKILLKEQDRAILESYQTMLDALGQYLGDGYELILHSLDDLEHSIIAIVHGHHSGRQVGGPITDFAMEMLRNIQKTADHEPQFYYTKNQQGTVIRSTTMPITGEGKRIIGLLCVNFYTDTPLNQLLPDLVTGKQPKIVQETFVSRSDDLIRTSVETAAKKVQADPSISTSNKNKEILRSLDEIGIFHFKDAVNKVAEAMNISRNTVYLHLRAFHQEAADQDP